MRACGSGESRKRFSRPVHGSSKLGYFGVARLLNPDRLMVMLLACLQGRANRLRPRTNRIYLLTRESSLFVHQAVRKQGHPLFPDLFTDQAEVLGGLLWTFLCLPILKVDMASAGLNVVDNDPGDWCNVAVPGPHGLAGMAVGAGSVQDYRDILGHLNVRLQRS